MHQIRAVSLFEYLDVAGSVGLDGAAMLRSVGLTVEALRDPENRIPAARVVRLLEESAALSGHPDFGLLLAQRRTFASLGPISMLLERLPNSREVVRFSITYQRYFNDIVELSMEEAGDACLIKFDLVPGYWGQQTLDLSLGVAFRVLAGASGGRWRAESVHTTRPPPADSTAWRRYFGIPVEFSSDWSGFASSREAMLVANPLADEAMVSHARRLLEFIPAASGPSPVSERVQRAIVALLRSGRATLDQVAVTIGMSPRSLQRHLAAEGLRFADVLSETRRELAMTYLAGSTHPITSVAGLLGYASPSAFTRWFAAAFGTSPQTWRAEASAGEWQGAER